MVAEVFPALPDSDEAMTIAIVNDDPEEANLAQMEIVEAGYQPLLIGGSYQRVDDLATIIARDAQGAFCDHRLSYHGFANFNGASLVASLYDLKIPSVLVTQFTMDIDNSIRLWRRKIPALLKRTETNPSSIKQGIQACRTELRGVIASSRKAYPSLIRVEAIRKIDHEKTVDVIVLNWDPHQAVSFPLKLVPEELRSKIVRDARLFADVNIGATNGSELFFENIMLAPDPDPNDGLA